MRQWQAERLQRTHADLLADARYGKAARFVDDPTAPKTPRARRGRRQGGAVIVEMLPPSGVETVADAIELDALSESLDAAMASAMAEGARSRRAPMRKAYRRSADLRTAPGRSR